MTKRRFDLRQLSRNPLLRVCLHALMLAVGFALDAAVALAMPPEQLLSVL